LTALDLLQLTAVRTVEAGMLYTNGANGRFQFGKSLRTLKLSDALLANDNVPEGLKKLHARTVAGGAIATPTTAPRGGKKKAPSRPATAAAHATTKKAKKAAQPKRKAPAKKTTKKKTAPKTTTRRAAKAKPKAK